VLNVKFLWLGHFLHYHTTEVHHTWSTHWSWCVHVRRLCVTWPWPHFHSLLLLLNLHKVFMIRSVSPLPYNRGSPYLVHTLIMEGMCQPVCVTWIWPHFHGLLTVKWAIFQLYHLDMLLHSDTLSWFRANQSLLLFRKALSLAEKQQIPIL
jgi:hypothetical protein